MSTSVNTAINLVNLTEVKSYLGDTGSSHDARYGRLINAVSARFEQVTERRLKARTNTDLLDGNGKNEILLADYPINSVSTNIDIRIDVDRAYTTAKKVGSTSIIIYSTIGKIKLEDDTFDRGAQSVKVVYNAGYTVSSSGSTAGSTGSIPDDLAYAALEYLQFNLTRERDNRVAVQSIASEGTNVVLETGMPWSVRQVLEKYRNGRYSE